MPVRKPKTVQLIVNGEITRHREGIRLADLVPDPRGVAVAVNGTVVRAADWPDTQLCDDDRVEVVTAHQGG
ncbi:sulfur carrier protein ThiS [Nocardioides alcanivorans]|uniref:sulfur carrier protein ThiS n=1 Tax=Nocardioides alcanivorans TaxID=2897352 RepID=UPI001F39C450|nr:sulfur carrier protein ThiS [Nocardioides alcanivorans]